MRTAPETYGKSLEAAKAKAARVAARLAEAAPWAGGEATWADVADMRRTNDLLDDVLQALGAYDREEDE